MADKAIIVIGAGDALGGAIARRFAREGYAAVIVRRHADQLEPLATAIREAGGEAHPFGADARQEDQMVALFEKVEAEIAPVEVCVFNIGANVRFPIAETTARVFSKVWEMACFSGFLAGREAAKAMTPRGHGTMIFTGATASLRGGEGFAAFASAKHGLRAVAQSMARELGPQGRPRGPRHHRRRHRHRLDPRNFPARSRSKSEDGILKSEHIADAYRALHVQPRDAWTHELDLRPYMEAW